MLEDWRKLLNDPETNERAKHTDALCALQIMVNMGWMNEAMYVRGMAFLERYKARWARHPREKVVPSLSFEHAAVNGTATEAA